MNPDPTSLDRLHDIVVPPPVPWWPLAPAWYWVLGYALFFAAALAFRSLIRWQRNRYRREALAELSREEVGLFNPGKRAAALAALAELLKRTALSAWPRIEVAALTGPAWLEFLDRTGRTTGFTQGPGSILERVAYDSRAALALNEPTIRDIAVLVRHWISRHQRESSGC